MEGFLVLLSLQFTNEQIKMFPPKKKIKLKENTFLRLCSPLPELMFSTSVFDFASLCFPQEDGPSSAVKYQTRTSDTA